MDIRTLLESLSRIEGSVQEAAAPKSEAMAALLNQQRALKSKLKKIEQEILALGREEGTAAKYANDIPNGDRTLAKLWRAHVDTMLQADEYNRSGEEQKAYRLDKKLENIYNQVASQYGKKMADTMLKHSDEFITGRSNSDKLRQLRLANGVSEKLFDPNNDFM